MVSGPSGSGKTTLCRRLADEKEAHYSISCTTRLPRDGEIDGKDYHFLTPKDFSYAFDMAREAGYRLTNHAGEIVEQILF